MSSIHIPPIPSIKMVNPDGFPSVEESIWRQQELQSRSPWTPYTPTTTHLTVITTNDCAYSQMGKVTHVRIGLTGTSDGTAPTVTLPFKAKSTNQTFVGVVLGVGTADVVLGGDFLTLTISKYDTTAPAGNGVVATFIVTGIYEAQ